MGVAPVLIGAVAISLAVKVVPSAPALAAAVGACGGAVVGVAMDGLYLVWASHHRQPTPPALSKAQVRLRQLTGAGFDDTIVLPSDWHEEACHIRLSPLGRSVFVVSEQIIDRLSSAELEAVIAHEMKHVIACDISAARRTTAALSFLALLALLYLGPWIDPGAGSGLAVFIAGAAGMTMARLVVELFLSRRREREADDFAAGVVGVAPVRSSLSKLSRSGPASLRTIWSTHDSVQDRLDRLREE
jgi:Zn-dependent protease with chaperone function